MDILENDIEDIIFDMFKESSDRVEDFGCGNGLTIRQPILSGYGKMDLLNIVFEGSDWVHNSTNSGYILKRNWTLNVIELKRGNLGYNEVGQLARYLTGLKRFIKTINTKGDRINIYGILIGKQIEKNGDFIYLLDKLENISVYTYGLDYKKGISFEESGVWYNADENFNKAKSELDSLNIKEIVREFYRKRIQIIKEENEEYQRYLREQKEANG